MAIVKEVKPYEYLVRFDNQGNVRGQHIKYIERVYDTETNEVYAEKEAEALPVGDAQAQVPLTDALGDTFAQVAKAEQQARDDLAAERAAKEAALAERDNAIVERDQANAARDQLLQPAQPQNAPSNPNSGG